MNPANNHQLIFGENLSQAWAKAFEKCYEPPGKALSPAIVSFKVDHSDDTWSLENPSIREALEDQLDSLGIRSANQSYIETVAGTIFPESIWRRCGGSRQLLFKKYKKMWPYIVKCRHNLNGTYFQRLIDFASEGINQLEEIIDYWEKGYTKKGYSRRSALQAGIFNPCTDHKGTPYQGFPCLQQVVFNPIGTRGRQGMSIVAFYANQYLIRRTYGNYLGLYRLGKFMAEEMSLELREVTCIASNLSIDSDINKGTCKELSDFVKKELTSAE